MIYYYAYDALQGYCFTFRCLLLAIISYAIDFHTPLSFLIMLPASRRLLLFHVTFAVVAGYYAIIIIAMILLIRSLHIKIRRFHWYYWRHGHYWFRCSPDMLIAAIRLHMVICYFYIYCYQAPDSAMPCWLIIDIAYIYLHAVHAFFIITRRELQHIFRFHFAIVHTYWFEEYYIYSPIYERQRKDLWYMRVRKAENIYIYIWKREKSIYLYAERKDMPQEKRYEKDIYIYMLFTYIYIHIYVVYIYTYMLIYTMREREIYIYDICYETI